MVDQIIIMHFMRSLCIFIRLAGFNPCTRLPYFCYQARFDRCLHEHCLEYNLRCDQALKEHEVLLNLVCSHMICRNGLCKQTKSMEAHISPSCSMCGVDLYPIISRSFSSWVSCLHESVELIFVCQAFKT